MVLSMHVTNVKVDSKAKEVLRSTTRTFIMEPDILALNVNMRLHQRQISDHIIESYMRDLKIDLIAIYVIIKHHGNIIF